MPWPDRLRTHRVVFSRGQDFVAHEMKANDLGHRSRRAITEMATHGIPDHGTHFVQGFALGDDGMPERRSNEATIRGVLLDFENDLAHVGTDSSARQARQCRPRTLVYNRLCIRGRDPVSPLKIPSLLPSPLAVTGLLILNNPTTAPEIVLRA